MSLAGSYGEDLLKKLVRKTDSSVPETQSTYLTESKEKFSDANFKHQAHLDENKYIKFVSKRCFMI